MDRGLGVRTPPTAARWAPGLESGPEGGKLTVRILVADDHVMVRQGVCRYIDAAEGLEVVAQASTGREALELAGRLSPDVAVLDIRMPDMSGLEATRNIRERGIDTAVLILTAYDDRESVGEAVGAGALGYVLKTQDAEQLVQAIRLVARGSLVIDPPLVLAMAEEISGERPRGPGGTRLSEREVEVLQLLSFGNSNRTVADKLYISPDTVKTHVEHIFQKLGASDRTAAVAEALRRRIIE